MPKRERTNIQEPRGIRCRKCGTVMEKVVDSRPEDDSVRRRRECPRCGWRGNSLEKIIFK